MIHFANPSFWKAYKVLPVSVRRIADRNFDLLKLNAKHPSLHFKKTARFWSVRVGIHYRALAVPTGDDLVWFWIGSHAEYDNLIKS